MQSWRQYRGLRIVADIVQDTQQLNFFLRFCFGGSSHRGMVISIFGLILIAIIYGLKGEWEGARRDCGSADLNSVPNLTKKCPKTLEFGAKNLYIVRRVKHMAH